MCRWPLKRHATSKISSSDDLWALHSLGFRGEALASIAEISRFTLTSATAEAETGTRLTTNDSGKANVIAWTCATGTSISVKDIFYNVPARRKFLKNAATEYAHCNTCVQALALSHPQVEFILHHNNREQLRVVPTPQADKEEALRLRAAALFGKETVAPLLYAEDKSEMAEVAMLFSPPGYDRAHNRHMFTFVNDRWIKSTTLKYGILRGYHSHLLKGRYPLVLLYLRVHPSLLDVNVHPMKSEVRFQYDKDVQELIALNLRRQLRSPTWSTTLPATTTPIPSTPPRLAGGSSPSLASSLPMRTSTASSAKSAAVREQRIFYPQTQAEGKSAVEQVLEQNISTELEREDGNAQPRETELDWAALTYIGTAARCYLLFEDRQQNFIVVDQHAFHERIIFEQLRSEPQILTRGQSLTIAEAMVLSVAEVEIIKTRQEEFTRLGFELQVLSDTDVLLKVVPALLQQKNYVEALQDLIALAQRDATEWFGESLLHDVVATIACRAAVKAGGLVRTRTLATVVCRGTRG